MSLFATCPVCRMPEGSKFIEPGECMSLMRVRDCPRKERAQHADEMAKKDQRIEDLEAEIRALRQGQIPGTEMKGETMSAPTPRTDQIDQWLREIAPDCGDNSCMFGGRGKGGMRTNGGCRCFKDLSQAKRIYVERLFLALSKRPEGQARTTDEFKCPKCNSPYFSSSPRPDGTRRRYCKGWPTGYDRDYHPCSAKYREPE